MRRRSHWLLLRGWVLGLESAVCLFAGFLWICGRSRGFGGRRKIVFREASEGMLGRSPFGFGSQYWSKRSETLGSLEELSRCLG